MFARYEALPPPAPAPAPDDSLEQLVRSGAQRILQGDALSAELDEFLGRLHSVRPSCRGARGVNAVCIVQKRSFVRQPGRTARMAPLTRRQPVSVINAP